MISLNKHGIWFHIFRQQHAGTKHRSQVLWPVFCIPAVPFWCNKAMNLRDFKSSILDSKDLLPHAIPCDVIKTSLEFIQSNLTVSEWFQSYIGQYFEIQLYSTTKNIVLFCKHLPAKIISTWVSWKFCQKS